MTSRSLTLVLLACLAALPLSARDQNRPGTGTATLSGRVVRSEGSMRTPVARVLVSVSLGDAAGSRQTVTDDRGEFEFTGLPAGGYLVTASRLGWVTTYYGSPRPGRPPGVRVVVAEAGKAAIEVPIVPGSVIAGRVVDENGQPMARQFPVLLEQRLVGNRQILGRMRLPYSTGAFERVTNDLGEFRLFGLPPGAYHLVVTPSISSGSRMTTAEEVRWAMQPPGAAAGPVPPLGAIAGYAPMFFPGTFDPSQSQPIVVGPSEVRDGLTFRIGFVAVARLEGVVRGPDGSPAVGARVTLAPLVPQVNFEGIGDLATADASGRFSFRSVPPGDYRLSARSAPPSMLWAETNLIVSGQDTSGLALTLAPASSMTGHLTFAATSMTPPADLTAIRLQAIATDALASAIAGGGSSNAAYTGSVAADGTFRISGLSPDRYNVVASWPGIRTADGSGWWLTTVLVGGNDIGDAPIDVRANEDVTNVTLGFRDRIGAIEGILTDAAGRPAPEYFVLAFPLERTSWTTTSRRAVPAVRPGTDGKFRVNGLLAGEYYLAVVTAVEADDAMDPAFLEAILPGAMRVTVKDGETLRQNLKIAK